MPTDRYSLPVFDEVGKHFGFGRGGDEILYKWLTERVIVWIEEFIFDGRIPNKAVYFLLVVPNEHEPEK